MTGQSPPCARICTDGRLCAHADERSAESVNCRNVGQFSEVDDCAGIDHHATPAICAPKA
jgi:hypothetical protein